MYTETVSTTSRKHVCNKTPSQQLVTIAWCVCVCVEEAGGGPLCSEAIN